MDLEILSINKSNMRTVYRIMGVAIVTALTLAGCVQDANITVKTPDMPPRLVITAFLTPQDTLIRVRVTKSRPVFGSSNINIEDPVTDATVKISGNMTTMVLGYDPVLEVYTVDPAAFPVVPGNTYTLEASAPGVETVTASTTVPAAPPSDFGVTMVYSVDSADAYWWTYYIESEMSFTDLPAAGSYYRLDERIIAFDSLYNDTVYQENWQSLLVKEATNGAPVTRSSISNFSLLGMNTIYKQAPVAMEYFLIHASEEYYKFHEAYYNFSGSGGSEPFTEASFMYGNIEKGYGIFASANYSVKRVNF
jgi:hypothetical protein